MSTNRKEATSPATKADLEVLRKATKADLEILRKATKADLEGLRKSTQNDLEELRGDLQREIRAEGKETRRHFDVVAEKMLHDFRGAFGDRTAQHGDTLQSYGRRLDTIESHLGLVV